MATVVIKGVVPVDATGVAEEDEPPAGAAEGWPPIDLQSARVVWRWGWLRSVGLGLENGVGDLGPLGWIGEGLG
jgi:hypothetical protein